MSSRGREQRRGTPVRAWLAEPMSPEVAAAVARLARAPGVKRIAVMPDVHLAEAVCVGCVVATDGALYPQAVGGDIGCGVTCVPLDVGADALAGDGRAEAALAALREAVPILKHRSAGTAPPLPSELEPDALSDGAPARCAARDGRIEFATLGRGNHFVELQADGEGRLWLTVHSGSRGVGQAVTAHHLARGRRVAGGLVVLEGDAAAAYARDAAWAERYAQASRGAMLARAAGGLRQVLGITSAAGEPMGGSHNHVREEVHGGETLWVHRKGASPAGDGEFGVIPGSMGTPTFHVLGRGEPASLRSSSHGAGRAMTRTEARRRISARMLLEQVGGVHIDARMAAALAGEAPGAYKDIRRVMRAQRDLVRIVRELRPLVSYKGV